jgi:hypothetical protein
VKRIAMWSGPRNISTAMMRSFGNRPDTFVCDEPLYAHYLVATGKDHPGRDEVIASQDADWRRVARWLTGDIPHGRSVWYQKHMAHHLLPQIERDWLDHLDHAFLIREPAAMLISLAKVLDDPQLEDTGLRQQVELFRATQRRTGATPPVIDARDVLARPRSMLEALCRALAIPFDPAMSSWPAGPRETDGVWAKHWYAAVLRSTCFEAPRERAEPLPESLAPLLERCLPLYAELHAARIVA